MKTIHKIVCIVFAGVMLMQSSNAQKISKTLEKQISLAGSDDYVRAVITMNDIMPVSEIIALSNGKTKIEARKAIGARIREYTSLSQRSLLDVLKTERLRGQVRNIRSIHSINKIIIEAKKAFFEKIKDRNDVRLVYYEKPAMVLCANTWNVEKINAHKVWTQSGFTGSGIKVGVFDTGTDYAHTDLHANIWNNIGEDYDQDGHTLEWNGTSWVLDPGDINGIDDDNNGYVDDLIGYDFSTYYQGQDNDPMDDHSHGTHVSGTIAGNGSAGTQTGIAKEATLMVCKVLANAYGYPSDVMEAIDYGRENGADILSLSIGWIYDLHYTPGGDDDPRADFRTVCDVAIAAGIVMCVAAGNEGEYASQIFYDYWGYPHDFRTPHNLRTPGDVPSVITVGATDINDEIATRFNTAYYWGSARGPVTWFDVAQYGDYQYPLGLMKPDVCAPGVNITSTHIGGGYEGGWEGTSMATPAVSGTVALMLQANPSLTHAQIKQQLQEIAIELGPTGKDSLYGSGRDEAFQAILISLAYANKSINSDATVYNNEHILERGFTGYLHEVFMSGGEIFYRRSSDNGTNWQVTARLSKGNGNNETPSIVAGYGNQNDQLRIVWQRKLDNYHYQIWNTYSTNGGTDWSAATYVANDSNVTVSYHQSNQGSGPGPTPVIGSFYYGGCEGSPSYLLVYAAQEGLHYRLASTVSSSWTVPSPDIVPGSQGYYDPEEGWSCTNWHPCLASYNSQDYRVNLSYDDRYSSVYSQIFYEDAGWNTRQATSGSYYRYSSIGIDYNNYMHGAWSMWNGSQYVIRFGHAYNDGSWSSWYNQFAGLSGGAHSFYPAITYYNKGGLNPFGLDIVFWGTANTIEQRKLDVGNLWFSTTLASSNAVFPNLTHERSNSGNPRQIWTSTSATPYSIQINSQNLPKAGAVLAGVTGEIQRAAEIVDNRNHSLLRVECNQPELTTTSGKSLPIHFKGYDPKAALSLSSRTIFDYLQTEQMNIPDDASSVLFTIHINATSPDTLNSGKPNTDKNTQFSGIEVEVLLKDASSSTLLLSSGKSTLLDEKGLHRFSKSFNIPLEAIRGRSITMMPSIKLSGDFKEQDLCYALVNIFSDGSAPDGSNPSELAKSGILAEDEILGQNYPNPFNPITTIAYRVIASGRIDLKLYDVLGREVATLVAGEKDRGIYTVNFDASHLASGIYFYRLTASGIHETRKMFVAK